MPELYLQWLHLSTLGFIGYAMAIHEFLDLQGVDSVSSPAQTMEPLPLVDMQRCRDRESKALQVKLRPAVMLNVISVQITTHV